MAHLQLRRDSTAELSFVVVVGVNWLSTAMSMLYLRSCAFMSFYVLVFLLNDEEEAEADRPTCGHVDTVQTDGYRVVVRTVGL